MYSGPMHSPNDRELGKDRRSSDAELLQLEMRLVSYSLSPAHFSLLLQRHPFRTWFNELFKWGRELISNYAPEMAFAIPLFTIHGLTPYLLEPLLARAYHDTNVFRSNDHDVAFLIEYLTQSCQLYLETVSAAIVTRVSKADVASLDVKSKKKNEKVQEAVIQLVRGVLDVVCDKLDLIPNEVRLFFERLCDCVDAEGAPLWRTHMASIFLLRFLSPALVRASQEPSMKLIVKILQNGATPTPRPEYAEIIQSFSERLTEVLMAVGRAEPSPHNFPAKSPDGPLDGVFLDSIFRLQGWIEKNQHLSPELRKAFQDSWQESQTRFYEMSHSARRRVKFLTDDQQATMAALNNALRRTKEFPNGLDSSIPSSFLYFALTLNEWKIKKAAKVILAYRKLCIDVDMTRSTPVASLHPFTQVFHDTPLARTKTGLPVMCLTPGRWTGDKRNMDLVVRQFIYLLLRVGGRGYSHEFSTLTDMSDWDSKAQTSSGMSVMFGRLLNGQQLPLFAKEIYVLNAPNRFVRMWSVFQKLMPKNLASRVKMLTPVDLPTYFAVETLPAPYGNLVSLDQEKSRWLHWRERMDGCDVLSLTAKDFASFTILLSEPSLMTEFMEFFVAHPPVKITPNEAWNAYHKLQAFRDTPDDDQDATQAAARVLFRDVIAPLRTLPNAILVALQNGLEKATNDPLLSIDSLWADPVLLHIKGLLQEMWMAFQERNTGGTLWQDDSASASALDGSLTESIGEKKAGKKRKKKEKKLNFSKEKIPEKRLNLSKEKIPRMKQRIGDSGSRDSRDSDHT
jgi:hypothetical protein